MKKRTLALLVALVLTAGGIVGGTLAWLTAKSEPVVNTFTTSDIGVTLTETEEEYRMVPGWTIHKDPKVAVTQGSEACYLFVKLEKSTDFDNYLTCQLADGWTALQTVEGVYYRTVEADEMGVEFGVLQNDEVAVKSEVTAEMMAAAKQSKPTLTITAYASQLYQNHTQTFTAAQAWSNLSANERS